jgi:hypothetical protein
MNERWHVRLADEAATVRLDVLEGNVGVSGKRIVPGSFSAWAISVAIATATSKIAVIC